MQDSHNRPDVEGAATNIAPYAVKTELQRASSLDAFTERRIYLKLENRQTTGSFKLRGAANKLVDLSQNKGYQGVVATASTGNHAAAVLHMSKLLGIKPIIFVPKSVAKSKLEKLDPAWAEIRLIGDQSGETERHAIAWAKEEDIPFIHPYNDPLIIAGQGTVAKEILEEQPDIEEIIVPVGGGGLIAGIAFYAKATNPNIRIIGAQPENACEMALSVKQNRIAPDSTLSTISDGTAGGLDPNTVTLSYCQQYVDSFILVSEEEIASALKMIHDLCHMMVEPAAALSLAAAIKSRPNGNGSMTALIVCGGSVAKERFFNIIQS